MIVLVTAAVAVLIAAQFAYQLHEDRERALQRAERTTQSARDVLVEHTARTFEAVDRALNAVAEVRADVLVRGATEPASVYDLLHAIHGASPVLFALGWTDHEGNRLYSSASRNPPPLNIADQEQFTVHVRRPDAGLYISAPIRSRVDGTWLVLVSRRLENPDGTFGGIVSGGLRLDYFGRLYKSLNLGPKSSVALRRSDGVALASDPPDTGDPGALQAGGDAWITSVAEVPGLPLSVAVGLSQGEALAEHYREVFRQGPRVALLIAVLFVGAGLLRRQLRRREIVDRERALAGAVFHSSADAIFYRDLTGEVRSWNEGARRLFGFTEEQIVGQPYTVLVPPDMKAQAEGFHAELAHGRRIVNVETVRRRKDGSLVDVALTLSPVVDRTGAVVGISTIARDLSQRKHAEQARETSDARANRALKLLRDAIDGLSDGFILYDADDRLVMMNEAARNVHPYFAEKAVPGTHLTEIVGAAFDAGLIGEPGDTREAVIARRLQYHRQSFGKTFERRTGDRWYQVREHPTHDGGVVVIRTDVTELKRHEEALQASEARATEATARLKDAIESLSEGFLLWDADDRLVLFNEGARRIHSDGGASLVVGASFEELMARRVRAGLIEQARGREDAYIRERLEHHRNPTGEPIEQQFADGRWVSVREHRTREGGVVSIRTDITELKQREAELVAARAEADAANQAKSEFLSRMSHELRTPLNAIIGFAQMLELDRPRTLTPDQREFSRFISSGGQHLLALVNDVLDLARIEAGTIKLTVDRVSVETSLADVLHTMGPMAAKAGVALEVEKADGISDLRADELRVRQVLLNLVSNAIKYNRTGGTVRVRAVPLPGRVRFEISDSGVGIAHEHHAALFQPFQRLGAERSQIEGTGIGLAICKRLVEAMGGSIGFASDLGKGSTFWVELPAAWGSAEPAGIGGAELAAAAPRAAAGGFTLLYVEDNPTNLRLMEHLMSTLPQVSLLSAPTPQLGLDLAAAHRPDVIVLDLNFPGMSGYEMLARLKGMPELRNVPIMALTAAALPKEVERGLAAGFFRYLTKPIDVKLFLAAVDAALGQNPRWAAAADAAGAA